ncbi:MAG: YfhO family protein [Ruminococcus sp.]|nr:YfhO family protein [Ruminococcus sp.]
MTAKAKKKNAVTPPSDRPTLAKGSFFDRYGSGIYLFLAFFIPFILIFFAFKVAGVSPFGTNQILVTDLWHQYYPFLVDFQDKLQHGGSLLWTWKSGGGTNYVALMSYYLASPLNFFSVLVPADKLREFLYIITCVKIGFAGFFYALFLRITFKRKDVTVTAFGVMYALCAFIMGYYWNIIWLDTIALLPLVIAGTVALLKEGKFRLYVISLALSILANYYIGLFTCIFVFLVSLGYCIVEYKGWKNLIFRFLKMAGCSLLSIMMSAILTLPAYFALHYTHSSDNTFPTQFAINIGSTPDLGGVLEGIGKTIANSVAFVAPTNKEGLPNVYCGVFVIFLAILFFFCSKIKKRERIFCGCLLLFFMLSFIIRQLDYVWHGFHFPNMLPHRFSFLYSFVLIYMAFRVFMYIDDIKLVSVIGAILGFAVYLGIAATYFDGDKVKVSGIFSSELNADPILLSGFIGGIVAAWVLLYSLRDRIPRIALIIGASVIGVTAAVIVLCSGKLINSAVSQNNDNAFYIFMAIVIILLTAASALLIGSKDMNKNHQMTKVVLSVLLLIIAMLEGLFSAASGVKANGVTDSTTYPLGGQDTLNCVAKVNELEENNIDLPHTEVNKYHSLNDNALIGADGISMFNSMVNKDVTSYMEKFGICGWVASNRYTYQESSPFTNLMLNVKYLIAPYGAYLDTTHNELIYQSGNVKLMQNKYYLPQGFVINREFAEYSFETAPVNNPMNNQNELFRRATGLSGDLYQFLESSSAKAGSENGSVSPATPGNFTYSSSSGNEGYDIDYTVPGDGVACAYLSGSTENVSIRVNGSEVIGYYIKRPFIMMVGNVKQGDTVTLHCSMNNSTNGTITAHCAMFNEDLFQQGYDKLSQSTLVAKQVDDTHISGIINAKEDGLFYTSISYAKGWKAYVDGEETEIKPVGNALLAFELSKGTHNIELKYTPEGFVPGLCCTLTAILIFIALCILYPKREKVFAKLKGKSAVKETAPIEDASSKAASAENQPADSEADKSTE